MKFGNQSRSSSLIINMIFEIAEIKNLGRFGFKIAICPIFMKFDFLNKLNMLIINILIGIDDLTQNYKFVKFGPKN